MTGLVGMTGGYPHRSRLLQAIHGLLSAGLLIFAILAMVEVVELTRIKKRWRTSWGAVGISAAPI
jgi:NNP family nitrate/nitrite transporter-like MFS transporter